ncbi:MAG: signal peptidase I [Eubacteriales bacterium]
MKKTKKLILNILCIVLLGAMLCTAVLLFVRRSNNEVTFIFDKASVWIVSQSMEDTIPARSYIQIEKVEPKDIKVGDVIMFYSDDPMLNGALNTHRVVEIIGDNEEFVTKGDNEATNPINDKYTAKADKIVGRYVKNLPTMTAVVRFFLTPAGFVIIALLFLMLTLAMCVPDFVKHFKAQKEKNEDEKKKLEEELIRREIERLKAENLQNDRQNEEK